MDDTNGLHKGDYSESFAEADNGLHREDDYPQTFVDAEMEDTTEATPLLPSLAMDWLGRPAHCRLGGWKCASCILGAIGLCQLQCFGVLFNLVVFLVEDGVSNSAAASDVAILSGTLCLCSLLGPFLSDSFLGRLWSTVVFQVLSTMSTMLVAASVAMLSSASSSQLFFFVSLYMMSISIGAVLSPIIGLGVDQLKSSKEKQTYFQVMVIMMAVGELLAGTVVTYLDNKGLWVWGFGICALASLGSLMLVAGGLRWFRQYEASGNPFIRNMQVFVAALRKSRLSLPKDSSLLYEYKGDMSAIPGRHKLPHTCTLSFLDKAAVLRVADASNRWELCTVTQVEELKSFLRAMPAAISLSFVTLAASQVGTLFVEQAVQMNRHFGQGFVAPPAALLVLSVVSQILTGLLSTSGSRCRLLQWFLRRTKQIPNQRAGSLFLLGMSLFFCFMAMVISALVELHRKHVIQKGALLSMVWLVPQTVLLGAALNLVGVGSLAFFYSEISESMFSVVGCISLIFYGAGGYMNSIILSIIATITTRGEQQGWIADNLDEGHADYFYWFLASCMALGLAFHITYAYACKETTDICQ